MRFSEWWAKFIEHFPQYQKDRYVACAAFDAGYRAAMEKVIDNFTKTCAK